MTLGNNGGNGSLTISGYFRNRTPATHQIDVPIVFSNPTGFVDIDNLGFGGGLNAFAFLANPGNFTVAANTTLAINNNSEVPLGFQPDFLSGIEGAGSVQIGTQKFVTGTQVALHGSSIFGGDLRMRNDVNVIQTASEHGSLSGVARVFIESPTNFFDDRPVLRFGDTDGSPVLVTEPDYIPDTAEVNLANGKLDLNWIANSYSGTNPEEVVGDVRFKFGDSFIDLSALSPDDPFTLRANQFLNEGDGTALLRVRVTTGTPFDPETAFVGSGYITANVTVPTISGNGIYSNLTNTQVPIVPFVAGANSGGYARTFLTYNGSVGFAELKCGQYATAIADPATSSADNVSISSETLPAGSSLYEVNALRLADDTNPSVLELNGNTLRIVSGALLFAPGASREIRNGNIQLVNPAYLYVEELTTLAANIEGNTSVTVSGSSELVLSGNNSYLGLTYLNQETIARSNNAFGSTLNGTELNQDVTVAFEVGASTVGENFVARGGGVRFEARDVGVTLNGGIHTDPSVPGEDVNVYFSTRYGSDSGAAMTINGNLTANTQPTDYMFEPQGDSSAYGGSQIRVNGVIADPSPSSAPDARLFKYDDGDLILANDNGYEGATLVQRGRLYATNQTISGSATGSGPVTVQADFFRGSDPLPLLGGDGRISGSVRVVGGAVEPHSVDFVSDVATLVLGDNLSFEINTFSPTEQDLSVYFVDLRGSAFGNLTASDRIQFDKPGTPKLSLDQAVRLKLNLLEDVQVGDFFDIAVADSGSLSISGFFLDEAGLTTLSNGTIFSTSSTWGPRSFQIQYQTDRVRLTSVVPEPASAILFTLGGLMIAAQRRRRP